MEQCHSWTWRYFRTKLWLLYFISIPSTLSTAVLSNEVIAIKDAFISLVSLFQTGLSLFSLKVNTPTRWYGFSMFFVGLTCWAMDCLFGHTEGWWNIFFLPVFSSVYLLLWLSPWKISLSLLSSSPSSSLPSSLLVSSLLLHSVRHSSLSSISCNSLSSSNFSYQL